MPLILNHFNPGTLEQILESVNTSVNPVSPLGLLRATENARKENQTIRNCQWGSPSNTLKVELIILPGKVQRFQGSHADERFCHPSVDRRGRSSLILAQSLTLRPCSRSLLAHLTGCLLMSALCHLLKWLCATFLCVLSKLQCTTLICT